MSINEATWYERAALEFEILEGVETIGVTLPKGKHKIVLYDQQAPMLDSRWWPAPAPNHPETPESSPNCSELPNSSEIPEAVYEAAVDAWPMVNFHIAGPRDAITAAIHADRKARPGVVVSRMDIRLLVTRLMGENYREQIDRAADHLRSLGVTVTD